MGFEGIGASVRRKEDVRFLSGKGNYTDDINRPDQLHASSSAPTGRTRRSTASTSPRPRRRPAWCEVFVGADMAADSIGGLPCGWQIHNQDGSPMAEPPHPVIAVGKVRHVGDPVAVVIAESSRRRRTPRNCSRSTTPTCRRSRA